MLSLRQTNSRNLTDLASLGPLLPPVREKNAKLSLIPDGRCLPIAYFNICDSRLFPFCNHSLKTFASWNPLPELVNQKCRHNPKFWSIIKNPNESIDFCNAPYFFFLALRHIRVIIPIEFPAKCLELIVISSSEPLRPRDEIFVTKNVSVDLPRPKGWWA